MLYNKIRGFFESKWFFVLSTALSALFVVFEKEAIGAIILLNVGALALYFSENILVAFLPALLASTFVIKCYDSATLFMPLWWTALFPVVSIVVYLVTHRRRFTVGKSFPGVVAVAVAVTLGGLFEIPVKDYFSGASIYYVLALGVGMVAAYLFVRSHITENDRYDIFEHFANMMLAVGVFAAFVVLEYYAVNFETTVLAKKLAEVQWSNNLSTMLMITMPFALFKMKKSNLYVLALVVQYVAILLVASRGGWIMGTLEFIICLAVGIFAMGYKKQLRIILSVIAVLSIFVAIVLMLKLLNDQGFLRVGLEKSEARLRLFVRSFDDFWANPIFGSGIGNQANADIYAGKQGTMVWYHMMIPQIVGSLGLVGIVCYGKQMWERFAMIFKNRSAYVWTLGLSYVGIFLMSQVNPGEFCPLPYELLTVVNFIMIEKYQEKSGAGSQRFGSFFNFLKSQKSDFVNILLVEEISF